MQDSVLPQGVELRKPHLSPNSPSLFISPAFPVSFSHALHLSSLSSLLTSHSSLLALLLIGGESGKGYRLGCVFHSSWGGGMGCWG